jgi:hypothetical protein
VPLSRTRPEEPSGGDEAAQLVVEVIVQHLSSYRMDLFKKFSLACWIASPQIAAWTPTSFATAAKDHEYATSAR